jgi:hypothetical protein
VIIFLGPKLAEICDFSKKITVEPIMALKLHNDRAKSKGGGALQGANHNRPSARAWYSRQSAAEVVAGGTIKLLMFKRVA